LDWFALMSPVRNPPVTPVSVWVTGSSLVTVTAAPGATVTDAGEKAKFLMVMVCELLALAPGAPPEGALLLEEHAAIERATPNKATTVAILRLAWRR
jgi:hypothetical protein